MTLNEFMEWLKANKDIENLNLYNISCTPEAGCSVDEIECELGDSHCGHPHAYRFDTFHGFSIVRIDVQNEWYEKYKDAKHPDPFPSLEETLDEFVKRIEHLKNNPEKCVYCETELESGQIVLE